MKELINNDTATHKTSDMFYMLQANIYIYNKAMKILLDVYRYKIVNQRINDNKFTTKEKKFKHN